MNNPPTRQQWIYDALVKAPSTSYADMCSRYVAEWSIGTTTFAKDWKAAQQRLSEYQSKANEAKEASGIAQEAKALELGIKSKQERVLALQKRADAIEAKLDSGIEKQVKIVSGKAVTFERSLDAYETSSLATTWKSIMAEISKIEGDYPDKTKKVEHSGSVGITIDNDDNAL